MFRLQPARLCLHTNMRVCVSAVRARVVTTTATTLCSVCREGELNPTFSQRLVRRARTPTTYTHTLAAPPTYHTPHSTARCTHTLSVYIRTLSGPVPFAFCVYACMCVWLCAAARRCGKLCWQRKMFPFFGRAKLVYVYYRQATRRHRRRRRRRSSLTSSPSSSCLAPQRYAHTKRCPPR